MKTPTPGYEEGAEISKLEISGIQLEGAITLFINAKFLCALAFAGTPEEMPSRLLSARGQLSAVEHWPTQRALRLPQTMKATLKNASSLTSICRSSARE